MKRYIGLIVIGLTLVFSIHQTSGLGDKSIVDINNIQNDLNYISTVVQFRVYAPTVPDYQHLKSDCIVLGQDSIGSSNLQSATQYCVTAVNTYVEGARTNNPHLIDTANRDINIMVGLINSAN